MPLNDGTGVTPGEICLSCGLYMARECPYGNHNKVSTLMFTAEINGVCMLYQSVEEGFQVAYSNIKNKIKKEAEMMTDSDLNVVLYRKIMALDDKNRKKLYNYWEYMFPKSENDFAKEMVSDKNESKQKNINKDKKKQKTRNTQNKFPEPFNAKERGK